MLGVPKVRGIYPARRLWPFQDKYFRKDFLKVLIRLFEILT